MLLVGDSWIVCLSDLPVRHSTWLLRRKVQRWIMLMLAYMEWSPLCYYNEQSSEACQRSDYRNLSDANKMKAATEITSNCWFRSQYSLWRSISKCKHTPDIDIRARRFFHSKESIVVQCDWLHHLAINIWYTFSYSIVNTSKTKQKLCKNYCFFFSNVIIGRTFSSLVIFTSCVDFFTQ